MVLNPRVKGLRFAEMETLQNAPSMMSVTKEERVSVIGVVLVPPHAFYRFWILSPDRRVGGDNEIRIFVSDEINEAKEEFEFDHLSLFFLSQELHMMTCFKASKCCCLSIKAYLFKAAFKSGYS